MLGLKLDHVSKKGPLESNYQALFGDLSFTPPAVLVLKQYAFHLLAAEKKDYPIYDLRLTTAKYVVCLHNSRTFFWSAAYISD